MSLIDEREAPPPGFDRLGYGTWSWAGNDSQKFFPFGAAMDYCVTKVVPMRIDRRQMRLV